MSDGHDTVAYRRLARDGAWNYGGQLLAAVIGLAMVPVLLDQLGAERYGVLVVAVTCALLAAFLDLGLGTAVTRDVASGDPDGERFVRSAGPAFFAVGVAGCLVLAGVGLAVRAGGFAGGAAEVPAVFALIGLGFCADQLTVYHTAVLGGVRRFDAVSALLVGGVALRAAGTLVVLSVGGGTSAVAGWYAATAWLLIVANGLTLRALAPRYVFTVARLDARALRSRLSYGAGSFAVMVSLGALWNTGPLIVAAMSGASASALFAVSQRFPMGALALPERLSVVLFPAASRAGTSAALLVARGTRLTLTALLPVAIVLLAGADAVMEAWLDEVPDDGPLVLRLTMLAVLAYGLCAAAVQVTWAAGEVRRLAVALTASAAIACAGGAALVALLGPVGAAWGLVAGAATAAAWTLALSSGLAGNRPWDVISGTLRDLGAPAAACAAVAGGVAALQLGEGWWRVLILGAAAFAAYGLAIALRRRATPVRAAMRQVGRRFPRLRSAGYLALDVRAAATKSARRTSTESIAAYEAAPDPWGYRTAWGDQHLELAERVLDAAGMSPRGSAALDLGCGEGWMTERVARRCAEVVAVDISETALLRARERCANASNVRFQRWDLLHDAPLGEFDLVLAMGVLEVFRRPSTLRRARRRILGMIAPGGHLLVTTTKQSPVVEEARWSARRVRGARGMDRFLCDSGELRRCASEESATHVITVYQRTVEA